VQIYEGRILSVPDMPAYVCDICGYQEFDYQAMQSLYLLMGRSDDPLMPDSDDAGLSTGDGHYNINDSPPNKP